MEQELNLTFLGSLPTNTAHQIHLKNTKVLPTKLKNILLKIQKCQVEKYTFKHMLYKYNFSCPSSTIPDLNQSVSQCQYQSVL